MPAGLDLATSALLVAFFVSKLVLIVSGLARTFAPFTGVTIFAGWWPMQVLLATSVLLQTGNLLSLARNCG